MDGPPRRRHLGSWRCEAVLAATTRVFPPDVPLNWGKQWRLNNRPHRLARGENRGLLMIAYPDDLRAARKALSSAYSRHRLTPDAVIPHSLCSHAAFPLDTVDHGQVKDRHHSLAHRVSDLPQKAHQGTSEARHVHCYKGRDLHWLTTLCFMASATRQNRSAACVHDSTFAARSTRPAWYFATILLQSNVGRRCFRLRGGLPSRPRTGNARCAEVVVIGPTMKPIKQITSPRRLDAGHRLLRAGPSTRCITRPNSTPCSQTSVPRIPGITITTCNHLSRHRRGSTPERRSIRERDLHQPLSKMKCC